MVSIAQVSGQFREGLEVEWLDATTVRVHRGACWVPGLQKVVQVTSPIDFGGISIANGAWTHLYISESGGVPAVGVNASNPVQYMGRAAHLTADANWRYLFSMLGNSSSQMYKWFYGPNGHIVWLENVQQTQFNPLWNGTATTLTTVSFTGTLPVNQRYLNLLAANVGSANALIHGDFYNYTPGSAIFTFRVYKDNPAHDYFVPLNASRALQYRGEGSSPSLYLYGRGWIHEF